MALLETLSDDFVAGTLDPKWTPTTTGGSTVTVSGGFLTLTTSASATNALAQIDAAAGPHSIVGSSISMRVAPQSQASGAVTALRIENTTGNGYAWIRFNGGTSMTVQCFNTSSTLIGGGSRTYNAYTWAYWRIRVDATVTALYFECSSDGVNWTIDTTCPNPGWGSSVRAFVYCQNSAAITAVTRIDSINIAPTGFADTITDDFVTPTLDPAKWTTTATGGGAVASGTGWATLTTSAASSTSSASITTVRGDLMLNGSWAMATAVEPSLVAGVGTYLQVTDGASNALTIGKLDANLVWFLNANAPTTIAAYNATTQRHWRIIATSAGVATPQYSADGITWLGSANSTLAWGGAVSTRFYVQNNNTAATGFSRVDAINMFGARTPVDQVTEDFPGSALDTTRWQDVSTTGGTVTVNAGLLNLTVSTTAIGDGPEVQWVGSPLSLTNSSVYAAILPTLAANTETALIVANSGGALGYAAVRFVGTTVFRTVVNTSGSQTLNASAAGYVPAEWAYVRIRMDAGNVVYFDRSPDAVTWTQVSSIASPGWGASVGVRLRLKNLTTGVVGTRAAAIDTINLVAPAPPILPGSLSDAETLGAPTLTFVPAIGSLTDDFLGGALDTGKWRDTSTASNTATVAGGLLSLTVNTTGITTKAEIVTVEKFNLTGGAVYVKVDPTTASGMYTTLQVYGTGSSGSAQFGYYQGSMYRRVYNAAGTALLDVNTPWAAGDWVYWRIRMDAGATNIYFDRSPNGTAWTQVSTVASPGWGADVEVRLNLNVATGTVGGAKTATYDSVNMLAAPPPTTPTGIADTETVGAPTVAPYRPPASDLTDDFPGTTVDTTKWRDTSTVGNSISVSGGLLALTVTTTAVNSKAEATSAQRYNLVNSAVYAKIVHNTAIGMNTELLITTSGLGYAYFSVYQGIIYRRVWNTAGTQILEDSSAWTAVGWTYWRIRMDAANAVYFDRSPDAVTWTQVATCGNPGWGSDVDIRLTLNVASAGATGTRIATVDSVNLFATPPPPQDVNPDGITNPDAVGAPALAFFMPVSIDGIVDSETLDGPTVAAPDSPAWPDSITDGETLGEPAINQDAGIGPDSITDAETFDDPYVAGPITVELAEQEFLGGPDIIVNYPNISPDSIQDPEALAEGVAVFIREKDNWDYGAGTYGHGPYYGYLVPAPPTCIENPTYGTGTYGCGPYYGRIKPDARPPLFTDVATPAPPLHILGIGPWSPAINWRGVVNYGIRGGNLPARPAIALPPASSKGFTLRLNEGSEARTDIAMRRGDAVIIDEMDTDLWWRRKDPRTQKLEVIGRFNCSNVELATSDTGVNLSAQWDDYATILGARMVLEYLTPNAPKYPTSMWNTGTLVTDILAWALPENTRLDLSEVTGPDPYPLGAINQVYHLPPGTLISDVFNNLEAISRNSWEWWIETPANVNEAPKLRFILGHRGADKGVTLFDVGSGPTPISSWTRNSAADNYANAIYFTSGGTGDGKDAGGGVVDTIDAQIAEYGQRDVQDGNNSTGGNIEQIRMAAAKRLAKLADRTPTFTITLAQGFWRGRHHIDVGDVVRVIIRLGKDVTDLKYRVTEIAVDIDDNDNEHVVLTLGRALASTDPRSKRSPIMRILRYLKNYQAPSGAPAGYENPDPDA